MFLVTDTIPGVPDETYLIFTADDPAQVGYTGEFQRDVELDYNEAAIHGWPEGSIRSEPCVGQDPHVPGRYKVLRYPEDRARAAYHPVNGVPLVLPTWADYAKLRLNPPNPEQATDEDWYDYLDKVDAASRSRRQRTSPRAPVAGDRDALAAWVAQEHLFVDSGIREVWFLPKESPPEEIRLLEVNDRLVTAGPMVEPIDFGLDVEGLHCRLFVADITSEQLQQIQDDPSLLPLGWSLDQRRIWRRRGA